MKQHKDIKITPNILRFNENLSFVTTWKQYEMLELLIQGVILADVSLSWLQQFREDLDLKV